MAHPKTELDDAIHAYIARTEPDTIAGSWILLCETTSITDLDQQRTAYTTVTHGNALTIMGMLTASRRSHAAGWEEERSATHQPNDKETQP